VDSITTSFWALGSRERVLEFLAAVGTSLTVLPTDRLETERRILLTEASGAEVHPVQGALALRFGVQGPGLSGMDELGLHRLSAEDVNRWAAERFTRGNAVVFLTGEPPADAEWGLPQGERSAPSEPRPIPYLQLPAVHVGGSAGVVVVAFVAERAAALRLITSIAQQRARQRLRYALGFTYDVSWSYDPLTRDLGHVTIWADSLPANAAEVARELMSVLDDLATSGPTEAELERELEDEREWLADPDSVPANLFYRAVQELLDDRFQTDEELLAELATVTTGDAAGRLAAGLETALLVLPLDTRWTDGRFVPYPLSSPGRVSGRSLALRGLNLTRTARRTRLVLGDEGVSVVHPDESAITVRFEDCVAVERWASGDRAVWGADGVRLEVVPQEWRDGELVARTIDERLAPELVVPMDREVEERTAEVDSLADAKVKRSWMTSDELKTLPSLLAPGERVVTLAQASKGWRRGVLALTERRLLFLYLEDLVEEIDVAEITSLHSEPPTFLTGGATLSLAAQSADVKYTDIEEERANELVDELRRRSPAS
jgi:zinc protease